MKRMLSSAFLPLAVAASLSIASFSITADTLLIDAISQEPPNDPSGLLRPTNGQSMQMVLAKFGEPNERVAPVGNPPITRWIYDEFTVYFERKLVVNSAVHLGPNN
jgi:hypothetical protein